MFNIPHAGHVHRNDLGRLHEPGRFRSNGEMNQERLFAEMLAHRHKHVPSSGQHPFFGGIGSHVPPFLGRHPPPFLSAPGMSPMMGGLPRHVMPRPMAMDPFGSGIGMGMGMGLAMGRHPHLLIDLPMGMDLGGRSPFPHSPYARPQHSPFGYHSPGPPLARPFLSPPHHHTHSPFSRPQHPSRLSFFDDDDFDDEFRMIPRPRRHRGRRGHKIQPRYAQRRRYGMSVFEDEDEEFEEDYDHEGFEEEDEWEMLGDMGGLRGEGDISCFRGLIYD